MRNLDSGFLAHLAGDELNLTELFSIELTNGTIYYYTTHNRDIIWDAASNIYSHDLPMRRGDAQLSMDSEADNMQVVIANIIGDVATKVKNNLLNEAVLTIKIIRWDDDYAADKEIIIFVGIIRVSYNRQQATFELKQREESLSTKFPLYAYQEPCNHNLFDNHPRRCTLTRSNYAYAGTATGGSISTLIDTTRGIIYKVNFDGGDDSAPIEIGDTVTGQAGSGTGVVVNIVYLTSSTGTIWYVEQSGAQFVNDEELQNIGSDSIYVNGTPAENTTFYERGELEITSGDNTGLSFTILSMSGNTITILNVFPFIMVSGVSYNIYPSCGYDADICKSRFNNDEHFLGFLHTPNVEEVFM